MKKYTVKQGENLGSIARKFWLPSWKYLYELNKDVIGDNPDLLKAGIKLQIPQWDSTSGDEKIKEKGANPFEYCNGLRYSYPWAPFSVTLKKDDEELYTERNNKGEMSEKYEKEKKYSLQDSEGKRVLAEGSVKDAEQLELLIPDAPDPKLYIDGILFE